MIRPCRLVAMDLSNSPANCHISDQNAQYSSSANIPFQMQHPLQLWASCDDQGVWTVQVGRRT